MKFLNRAPLVRLLFPFILGILAAIYLGAYYSFEFTGILFAICFGVFLFTFHKKIKYNYRFRWLYGFIIYSFLFLCGYQLTIENSGKFNNSYFGNEISNSNFSLIKIDEPPVEKENSVKIIGSVISIHSSDNWKKTSGKALFYFQNDSLSAQLKYGDMVLVKNNFSEINPPQNPSEFNYKRYLSFHKIYLQSYIPTGSWLNTGINKGNYIRSVAINTQHYFLAVLKKYHFKGQELAVTAALLLGYKNDIDQETTLDYAASGALHVLSVSGLHVGIIFVVFNALLFFLDKIKYGNILKAILLLILLWFYAILTGLSPSVLRASTMLSFVVIANAFNRNSNIYNTLAASAFLLLLINPYLIMEVGFELSYLGVIGIVSIFPWIYNFWKTKNWLLDKIWSIMAVSIAAQLITFPLGLYYFHQFPNYFIFSNLVVIPLATLAIYFGMLLFITSKMLFVAKFFAKILLFLVNGLNLFVNTIHLAPYSLIQGISISVAETWVIYSIVIFMLMYFMRTKIRYLFMGLGIFIFLLLFQVMQQNAEQNQSKFIVYNIPKMSACDFIEGKNNFLLADTSFINNESAMLFHIKHNWWNDGIHSHSLIGVDTSEKYVAENFFLKNKCVQFKTKKIVFLDGKNTFKNKIRINKLKVDYLIVSHNPKINIKKITENYDFKKIIFDASNSKWNVEKWMKVCKAQEVEAYSVIHSGAYVVKI